MRAASSNLREDDWRKKRVHRKLMAANLFKKLYGSSVIVRNLPHQRRVPFLPREELHRLRDKRLREMIDYAAKTVPYYRTFFKENKIDPSEIKTVDDLVRLPLIDKQTVRNAPRTFVSESKEGKESIHFVTSGTTAKPLEIYHDVKSLLTNIAFGEREKDVVKKLLTGFSYKELYFGYTSSTIQKVRDIYDEWTFFAAQEQKLFLSVLQPFDEILDEINRFKPTLIVGYGSFLEILFRTIHQRKIQIHLPKLLIYVAEAMTPEGRRLIEEAFAIPVLSRYNAVEIFKIGYFCEARKGFHVHEDLCHLRIIDSANQSAKTGEKGEVVISNFINRGTVLLNYRLGDIAALTHEECPCGRTFRILSELEGRTEDIVFLSDGRFVHPRAIWNIFKNIHEVLQYQLIQYEPQHFELKLVTVDRKSYDTVIEKILGELKTLFGNSCSIESNFYAEIGREGKFRPVISHCRPIEYK